MTGAPADVRGAPSSLWLWGPAVFQMALIFAISSISDLTPPAGISDKSGHSIGYAILGALLLRALARGRLAGVTWGRAATAVVLATLYGISDEFHQMFVPGRMSDVHDVMADFAGAAVAVALCGAAAAVHACGILKRSS